MKGLKLISVAILLVGLAACGAGDNSSTPGFITVDVNTAYPEKELILQDCMDVEYVVLETTDEFITHGLVKAIGQEVILVTNRLDGNIFIFDRSGKGIRKINRLGQSGEEYSQTTEIILDEENQEMFVTDYPARKILVYDLYGNFQRSFPFADTGYYDFVFNYDRDCLILYKSYLPMDNEQAGHLILSKQDGSLVREIPLPVKEIRTPKVIMEAEDVQVTPTFYLTVPSPDNWVLLNASSDTMYTYGPDHCLNPFIVRTPSIHSMDTEVFLFLQAVTDRYYFLQTLKKEFNLETMKGFPTTDLLYDKLENSIVSYTLYNADFLNRKKVYWSKPVSHEILSWQTLDAFSLIEANENGQLKGRLKEIAAELDEEDNPVIMLIKHRL